MINTPPQFFEHRGWHFATRPSGDRYLAWASRSQLTATDLLLEPERKKIYFCFGETREQAISKLKVEVLGYG